MIRPVEERRRAAVLIVVVGMMLLAAGSTPDEEALCRAAADLGPSGSAGEPTRVESDLTPNGSLLRWAAGTGDTLQLTLLTENPGTYSLSLFAVHEPKGAVLSAKLWERSLTRHGETEIALHRESGQEVLAVRFDEVSLGPGRHILELSCLEPGNVLLDCVALRRTGEMIVLREGDARGGRPFLGVEMGRSRDGGVVINRTVAGSAAAEAGIEAGDVIVRAGGEPIGASDALSAVILRHRPGDPLQVSLVRDGELIEMDVTLGRRSETGDDSRAARVIEVLDVRPGQVIADIGTGSGWLAEAIARTLGGDGLVYAVEIDEDHVRRLHRWTVPNVVPVLSLPHDVSLPQDSLDTAMLHDVASHIDRSSRPRFYKSVSRALKPHGRLVIFGPHGKARSMLDELRKYGFNPLDEDELAGQMPEDLDQRLNDGIVFRYLETTGMP